MPKFGSTAPKCAKCEKSVYPQEIIKSGHLDGHVYHNTCFKCYHCNSQLRISDFAQEGKAIYCQQHFREIVGRRGGYEMNSSNPHVRPLGSAEEVVDKKRWACKCGADVTNLKFCGQCGEKVEPPKEEDKAPEQACPGCGCTGIDGKKFCGECGHKL